VPATTDAFMPSFVTSRLNAWMDALFERGCGTQYSRALLPSTTMELTPLAAIGLRPSVHAAAEACKGLPVRRYFSSTAGRCIVAQ